MDRLILNSLYLLLVFNEYIILSLVCNYRRGEMRKVIVFRILETVAPSNDSTYDVGTEAP
jgi:hypothetical protein